MSLGIPVSISDSKITFTTETIRSLIKSDCYVNVVHVW